MAVDMKRSTNIAPVSLSSSYFTGSEWAGISMITLISFGTSLPDETLSRFIANHLYHTKEKAGNYTGLSF